MRRANVSHRKTLQGCTGTSRRLEELPEASQYAPLGEAIELDHR